MRALLALLAIVLLGGALWFLSSGSGPDGPAPADLVLADEGLLGAGDSAALAADPDLQVQAPGSGPEEGAAAGGRQELVADEEEGEFLTVQVVDENGEPIPDATVYGILEQYDWNAIEESRKKEFARDQKLTFLDFGTELRVDGEGMVRVPVVEMGANLCGWTEDSFGTLHQWQIDQGDPDETPTLELRPDVTLSVRVLDEHGEPAEGVQVMLLQDQGIGEPRRHQVGLTQSDGVLERLHFQTFGVAHGVVTLAAGQFGSEGEGVSLDLDAIPEETIVLQLGPTGSLTVRFLDVDGTPFDLSGVPYRYANVSAHASKPNPNQLWNNSQENREMSVDGVLQLHHVPLDHYFGVLLHSVRQGHEIIRGPTLLQRAVEHVIRMDAQVPQVVGRALGVDGEPVSETYMWMSLVGDRGMREQQQVRTTKDGSFRAVLRARYAGKPCSIECRTMPSAGAVLSTRLELTLQPGVNDVGDRRLGVAPVIVSGRFVSDSKLGQPVQMRIERRTSRGNSERWERLWQYQQDWSNRDFETFAFYGTIEETGPFRVCMENMGGNSGSYLPVEPVPFTPGQQDLVIELSRGGSAEVEFLVDEDTPWRSLIYRFDAVAEIEQQSEDDRWQRDYERHQRGGWYIQQQAADRIARKWSPLRAGAYRLRVLVPGAAAPLVEIDDITIAPGKECEDPRIQGIDLTGKIGRMRVHLRDERGAPVATEGALLAIPEGDGASWQVFEADASSVTLPVVGTSALDVVVAAPGYVQKEVEGVTDGMEIYLSEAPTVELQFDLPGVPAGHQLQVALSSMSSERRSYYGRQFSGGSLTAHNQQVSYDPTGGEPLRLPVPQPGKYGVQVYLYRGGEWVTHLQTKPGTLDLSGEFPGSHVLELSERSRKDLERLINKD